MNKISTGAIDVALLLGSRTKDLIQKFLNRVIMLVKGEASDFPEDIIKEYNLQPLKDAQDKDIALASKFLMDWAHDYLLAEKRKIEALNYIMDQLEELKNK